MGTRLFVGDFYSDYEKREAGSAFVHGWGTLTLISGCGKMQAGIYDIGD